MIFEKQEYQVKCIDNIITLLKNFDFKRQDNLKECLKEFYKSTFLPMQNISDKLNLDILMETGTGKTFTYLNLIFELHKIYKQNKFIIFVPRKAILESVRQNIELTKTYFYSEYQKYLKAYYYSDSKSQNAIINHYISNKNELSILVLTNSAIDKKANLLNQQNENLFNLKSVFENIIDLKPISIIDEPHLLKGKAFNEYFSKINSLYFRFGATFPKEKDYELSNIIYCLDSISAFKEYLVKQVKVHTLGINTNNIFLKVYKNKKAIFTYTLNGIEREETIKLQDSFSLLNNAILTQVKDNKAYFSNEAIIEKKESYVLNNDEIKELLKKAIDLHFEKEEKLFKKGIKALSLFFIPNITDFRGENPFIKNTFEELYKEKRKEILKLNLDVRYKEYLEKDFDEAGNLRVHQGYFSGDKGSPDEKEANGVKLILEEKEKLLSFDTSLRFIFSVWALQEGWDNPNIFTLTKLSNSSSQISIHQQVGRGLRLCVNDKGKRITHNYLDFDDNQFYDINYLDILVSAREVDYIENLQKEVLDSSFRFDSQTLEKNFLENLLNVDLASDLIYLLKKSKLISFNEEQNNYKILSPIYESIKDNEEFKELLGDKFDKFLNIFKENSNNTHKQIIDAKNQDNKVKIRTHLAKDFKELWEKINKKAQIIYQNINEQNIIDEVILAFNALNIEKERVYYERKLFDAKQNSIITEEIKTLEEIDYKKSLYQEIQNLLLNFSKDEKFPLVFLLKIYEKLDKTKFENSPKKAFNSLKNIIKDKIHHSLLHSINYEFSLHAFSNSYENLIENGEFKESIAMQKLGRYKDDEEPAKNYLYESVIYDSNIEKEIIKENHEIIETKTIKVFAKLPKLSIPTPYKNYEPDFAYFLEDQKGKKIFFVCESKGYDKESDIALNERKKIDYARVFFQKLDKNLKDENIKIIFNTRINKQKLIHCINEVLKENNA
ncbi:DEAD/DEAH box helicase family protein [Campylobacter jejuni]|uniref:restriction endonuclease n=3 Tax=Campylobacter jejuni TaxID=197 RepID=UPI000C28FF0C|nr:DEAD/DEAH box helicase family protein [Campylobacter jejuni]EAJ7725445.1 DEAD/DEAH box helicase [Campylobacter jejuni]EAK5596279.1 DEAD/DEAH box helicase [Campylobacter jejuni]EDP4212841.1 DEAD/DEAH box helicase [Campylobacter jejuni]EEL0553978.1 DEAD/DEAH box helicase family protein [Campylobacter jejuni]EJG3314798.1 DEAD/DEAH box helicase family protein [Campylobacter jejuni]